MKLLCCMDLVAVALVTIRDFCTTNDSRETASFHFEAAQLSGNCFWHHHNLFRLFPPHIKCKKATLTTSNEHNLV